jgi:hypothetical protein
MHARRQESEAFQKAFYMRVLAFAGFEQKTPCYLRILLRELAAHLPQKA